MDVRGLLLTHLTAELANTSYRVSGEIPWVQSGTPLHLKNPRVIYLDQTEEFYRDMHNTLGDTDRVFVREIRVQALFTADAKNTPASTQQVLQALLDARRVPPACHRRDCEIRTENNADRKIYIAEYRFETI